MNNSEPPVVFLHGLESGPHGSKFQALKRSFPNLTAPDCTGIQDVEERYETALSHIRPLGKVLVVGSSFGGLVAVLLGQREPELLSGLVLCAPALHLQEAHEVTSLPLPTLILHGNEDEVVPIQASVDFAERLPSVTLFRVSDGHRLKKSHEAITGLVQQLRQE